MQGGHGYGGYGYGGYGGYDAGAYSSAGGYGYGAGGYYYSSGNPSAPAGEDGPLGGLELQPSEACPRNYVIFDQTCTDSRVLFHPSLARELGASSGHGGCYGAGSDSGGTWSPPRRKEDAEEIDALLSSEDDDVASTGRTPGHDGGGRDGSSPESGCGKPRKKERVKKMMRALKGIIPGGDQMDTPAVLDEVVRHLKSLKVEAKKRGVRGSDS